MPCPPCRQRIGTRKVHADEPVRSRTGKCRLLECIKIAVIPQVRIRLLDAPFIECIEQNALDRLFYRKVVEHLIDQKLTLAVWITAMDDFIRLVDQLLHDGKLPRRLLIDDELPRTRNDRKILRMPLLILWIIFVRLCLSENMPEQPRHDTALCHEAAVGTTHWSRKTFRELTPHARFLRNIQAHVPAYLSMKTKYKTSRRCVSSIRRWRGKSRRG